MLNILSLSVWSSAGLIFVLRVGDMSLDTLRVLFVMRDRKAVAWVLGFFQASIFVMAIGSVLSHLDNPLNILDRNWIDTGERLIQKHEVRIAGQRPRDFASPSLPT